CVYTANTNRRAGPFFSFQTNTPKRSLGSGFSVAEKKRAKIDCGGRAPPPSIACQTNPPNRSLGSVFTVARNELVKIDCGARDPGSYHKVVLVGDNAPATCPELAPKLGAFTHVLDVEIVP